MYGVIFSAKIDIVENEPPVNWLKKSKDFCESKKSVITDASTPGTGN